MTDKREALQPILEKVEKLFAMLGSDNRDEIANAAAKMNEILKKAGLDLHDLWQLGWNDKKDELAELFAKLFTDDVDVLLKIGRERASYFCNDTVFADVVVRGHRNTYAVESKAFAKWVLHQFFLEVSDWMANREWQTSNCRCIKEVFGIQYEWSLDVSARIPENVDISSARVVTVPLDSTGHVTDAFYLDSLGILLFGIYAFLAEWRFGSTFGKQFLSIQVRALAGAQLDCRRAAMRAMMRLAAFFPAMTSAGLTTGSVAFAWWLFEHPAWKIVGGSIVTFWFIAFVANFITATDSAHLAMA